MLLENTQIETRTCKKCCQTKIITDFSFINTGKKVSPRWSCKKCMVKVSTKHDKNNPEMAKKRSQTRILLEKSAVGSCSQEDKNKTREFLEDKCAYCGVELENKGHLDHIIPLSKGGTNWPYNLTWCCSGCNQDKHSKNADEFIEWRQKANSTSNLMKVRKLEKLNPFQ